MVTREGTGARASRRAGIFFVFSVTVSARGHLVAPCVDLRNQVCREALIACLLANTMVVMAETLSERRWERKLFDLDKSLSKPAWDRDLAEVDESNSTEATSLGGTSAASGGEHPQLSAIQSYASVDAMVKEPAGSS